MSQQGEWIKCPICGWHWKWKTSGRHAKEHGEIKEGKEFTFLKGNLENDAFISIRDLPGGRGNPDSFKELERISLKEAKNIPEYKNLINSLKKKIKKIEQILQD